MKSPIFPLLLLGTLGTTACSTHTMFDADPTRFTVYSKPEGATVTVMGQVVGTTPVEVLRKQVFPGLYDPKLQAEYGFVTITAEGCEPLHKPVSNSVLEDDLKVALKCQQPAIPTTPAAAKSTKERLLELKKLYKEGLLTKQEYEAKRRSIIDSL